MLNQSKFNIGDWVLIAPDVTHKDEWLKGVVVDIEQNPFVGIVITAETENKLLFFEREELFKKA